MIVGIVSGYFNPLHQGHIEYMNAARNDCNHLVAIINNDKQVVLKGSAPFMDEQHRAFIVQNLKAVDSIFVSIDTEKTVCESIKKVHHDWTFGTDIKLRFYNSGDRVHNSESAEVKLCKELGIEYITLPLPKRFSSSELKQKL